MEERINWIDNIRAFGIFLVVLGHITFNKSVINYIYSFHMPLFFVLSGYLYNGINYSFKKFFLKKVRSLLLPYLGFALFSLIIWSVFKYRIKKEEIDLISEMIGIVRVNVNSGDLSFNIPLWFLPCLFVVELVYFYSHKKWDSFNIQWVCVSIISILGYINAYYWKIHLPFVLDVVATQLIFFHIGVYFKTLNLDSFIRKWCRYRDIRCWVILIFFVLVQILLVLLNGRIDVLSGIFGFFPLYLINAIFGCFCMFYIFSFISFYSKIWLLVSKSTLYILGFHGLFIYFRNILPHNFFLSLVQSLFIIVVIVIMKYLISSFISHVTTVKK